MSSLFALISILAGNVAFGRLQIESDVACPTAADVSAGLRQLLGAELSAPSTLSVSRRDASLEVRLTDGNGATLGERTWPRSDDCAADAQAIAVVTAAWAEDLPPVREALVAPPPAPPSVAAAAAPAPRDEPARVPGQLTFRVGTGVASPISTGQSSSRFIWPVPTLQLDLGLRDAGAVAAFGSLGLFADLPRERGSDDDSWYRYTLEPMGGVAMNNDGWSFIAVAGLSVGFVESGMTEGFVRISSTYFDAGVVAEVRARYTLGIGHGKWGLWMSLRGRAALEREAYESWGATGPSSPYEAALLVGGDYSWLR
jgi:hypothetical protein